ncbi:Protein of unknown function, partial [Gryllus bimaculatus]
GAPGGDAARGPAAAGVPRGRLLRERRRGAAGLVSPLALQRRPARRSAALCGERAGSAGRRHGWGGVDWLPSLHAFVFAAAEKLMDLNTETMFVLTSRFLDAPLFRAVIMLTCLGVRSDLSTELADR